jgi:L-seryl-tRNA(Ser) seleniumtransferase
VNARGYSTKVGGCRLAPEVIEAMAEAADYFVRIEDLQAAAGEVIARLTGAESGYVTSGATAGLTLAAAAAMAGLDVARMDQLPNAAGMPNEIVCLRRHRNDYDHALRAAGARIVEVGFNAWTFTWEVEAAIGSSTCALFYLASDPDPSVSLEEMVRIAHAHGLPVIVDASLALPPASNLRAFIAAGADLVALSGGKHVEGPQASGILCGREELIRSVALQQQDMDVYPQTWPLRSLIADGSISGPPHHGLGRGFKVGKEEIAGLIAALERYVERDFIGEGSRWCSRLEEVAGQLRGIRGLRTEIVDAGSGERPVPLLRVYVSESEAGLDANALISGLQDGDPIVCTYEPLAASGIVVILPESLREEDPSIIGRRVREVVVAANA